MRYKLVLKVFAESETTGESVELCPGGLIEEHPSMDALLMSLQVACEQGWGAVSAEQLSDFYTRLEHEAGAVTRVLNHREQVGAPGSEGKGKNARQKCASLCEASVR